MEEKTRRIGFRTYNRNECIIPCIWLEICDNFAFFAPADAKIFGKIETAQGTVIFGLKKYVLLPQCGPFVSENKSKSSL